MPAPTASLLALHGAIGNQAAARLFAERAPAERLAMARGAQQLQRSCLTPGGSWNRADASEVVRQITQDEIMVAIRLAQGAAMIRAAHQAQMAAAVPEHDSPGGSPMTMSMSRRSLQRATAVGNIQPGGVVQQQQLAIPGPVPVAENVKLWKGAPAAGHLPAIAVGAGPGVSGYRFGSPHYPLGLWMNATGAKLRHSALRPGSGVGDTRPLDWWLFLSLLGLQRSKWVQGHLINSRLGGKGKQKNLAPFTYSMNSVHYWSVERYVIHSLTTGQDLSYSVKEIKNQGGSQNEAYAIHTHRAFLAFQFPNAVSAIVGAGWLHNEDALAVLQSPHTNATHTPNSVAGATWGQVKQFVENWIATYILHTFPAGINCRARYYTTAPGGGRVAKQVGQVLIDNT